MEVPVKVYRRRRRPFRRLFRELAVGTVVGFSIYAYPFVSGLWRVPYLAGALLLTATLWKLLLVWRKGESKTIRIYRDRVSWHGPGDAGYEARFDDIFDVVPDRSKTGFLVRSTRGAFDIHAGIEGYSDLRRRLDPGLRPPESAMMVLTSANRSFRFRTSPHAKLGISSLFAGLGLLFAVVAGVLPLALPFLVLAAAIFGFGVHLTFFAPMARIEIRDGALIRFGWRGQVGEPIRLSSIVGAGTMRSPLGRIGIIDTDRGEVSFSMELEGAEDLIREAERLGTLRLALERSETPIPERPITA
ncbi:MAG: hypothetical protein ACO1SV_13790 [Fimbriimonas sp.]